MNDLDGMDTVMRNLDIAMAAMAGPAAKEAESQVADDLAESARGHAAVLTGALRGSIKSKNGEVTADDEAAGPNEFGTSHMSAQPFMRPAMNEATKTAPPKIVRILRSRVPFLD